MLLSLRFRFLAPVVVQQSAFVRVAATSALFAAIATNGLQAQSADLKSSGVATTEVVTAPIDDSAVNIVAKELELEKLSVRFMLNTVSKGRWKGWRYFSFQEANAALIESGLITAIDQRLLQIHQNGVANTQHLENSLYPQMIGQCIGVLGDATELGINAGHSIRAHELSLDPAAVKKKAISLNAEINENLAAHKNISAAERAGAFQNNFVEVKQLYEKESEVLNDLHQLTWMQFSTFSTTLRRLNVTQNAFYTLDLLKNATGAIGNGVGLMSLRESKPILGVPANILTTVSGVFVMVDPFASRAIGKYSGKLHDRFLFNSNDRQREAAYFKLCDDVRVMKSLAAQLDSQQLLRLSSLVKRIAVYEQHEEQFARYVRELQEERQKAYTAALNQGAVAGVVGGAKATNGILGIIASDRYPTKPRSAAPLQFAAATIYAPGMALALGVNLNIEIKREIAYQKNKEHGRLPRQLLSSQLTKLDSMESSVKSLAQEK